MSKFPTIRHINDLLPLIDGNPQFRAAVQPNGHTVICYMLQDEDTFTGANEEYAKECRGITFGPDGTVSSRTLHKFQNVGENAQTQPDQIPWDRIVRVMDKRDGSMITPVLMSDGTIQCKTKKTFTSNEAIAATEFLHQIVTGEDGYKDQPYLEWVRRCLRSGFTPTFEWTSPRFPIVLTYEKDELTLLHVRDNETGEYQLDPDIWEMREELCPFPIAPNLFSQFAFEDPRKLLELAKTTQGVEGWIIQADDGDMWKIKTQWYIDLHHSVTFTRWRDVARTVLDDGSDDLKAAFAMTGRSIKPIVDVEWAIHHDILQTTTVVNEFVRFGKIKGWTPKEMALAYKDQDVFGLFGLIMTAFRGKDVDYREWYRKNHLNSWSLEVIPTAVQNEDVVAEATA